MRTFIFLLLALAFVACKKAAPPAQAVLTQQRENLLENCPNCDFECFEKKTNAAFERQIECLRNVKMSLMSENWVRVVNTAVDLGGLISFLVNTQILIEKDELVDTSSGDQSPKPSDSPVIGSAAQKVSGVVNGDTYTFWAIIRDFMSGNAKKIPIEGLKRCVPEVSGGSKKLEKIYSKVIAITTFEELTFTSLKELGTDLTETTIEMHRIVQSLKSCKGEGASKAVLEVVKQVDSLESKLSLFEKYFMPMMTIVNCSVGIYKGSVVLANNMQCLMDDLDNLTKSEERLKKSRNSLLPSNNQVSGAANSDQAKYANDQSLCYGDPHNCPMWAMGVYGEYLRRNAPYFGKAAYCSSRCRTNSAENQQKCEADSAQIFTGEAKNCGEFCQYSSYAKGDSGYCLAALNRCISYCCSQDGACATEAKALK